MKLWHWKSHWISRVTQKKKKKKKKTDNSKPNAENFSMWFKIFKGDFISVIQQQREKISVIFTVVSFLNNFQCDFRDFSVSQKFSVWFSVS